MRLNKKNDIDILRGNKTGMKKFRCLKNITIVMSVIYFCLCVLSINLKVTKLHVCLRWIYLLSFYSLPAILIICWMICIDSYLKIRFDENNVFEREVERKKINKLIGIIVLLSIFAFCSGVHVFFYMELYNELIKKLIICIVILLAIFVGWLFFLIWYTKNIETLGSAGLKSKKLRRVCLWIIMIGLSVGGIVYSYYKGEDEWFKDLVERTNQEYMIQE